MSLDWFEMYMKIWRKEQFLLWASCQCTYPKPLLLYVASWRWLPTKLVKIGVLLQERGDFYRVLKIVHLHFVELFVLRTVAACRPLQFVSGTLWFSFLSAEQRIPKGWHCLLDSKFLDAGAGWIWALSLFCSLQRRKGSMVRWLPSVRLSYLVF